jgi:hypothetical protein
MTEYFISKLIFHQCIISCYNDLQKQNVLYYNDDCVIGDKYALNIKKKLS